MGTRLAKGQRLELTRRAIGLFVPHIAARGRRVVATHAMPSHMTLDDWGLHFILSGSVLRLPSDRSMSSLLDIWSSEHLKQLSVSWQPTRPWEPLHVSTFVPHGEWIALLDRVQPLGDNGGLETS